MRKLIDERFGKKTVLRVVDTAPGAKRHMGRTREILNIQIGNVIRNVGGFRGLVLVDKMVLPRNGTPRVIKYCFEPTQNGWPVVVLTNVFFATPDEFYRDTNRLCQQGSLLRKVGLRPATEAAAEILVVNRDIFSRKTQRFGNFHFAGKRVLRARPDLTAAVFNSSGRVERLHAGVRQVWDPILGCDRLSGCGENCCCITAHQIVATVA